MSALGSLCGVLYCLYCVCFRWSQIQRDYGRISLTWWIAGVALSAGYGLRVVERVTVYSIWLVELAAVYSAWLAVFSFSYAVWLGQMALWLVVHHG